MVEIAIVVTIVVVAVAAVVVVLVGEIDFVVAAAEPLQQ